MNKKCIYPEKNSLLKEEPYSGFLSAPTEKTEKTHKRVSFCDLARRPLRKKRQSALLAPFKRGSLTVEAAFALPLMFFTIICIISIMGVYTKTLDTMVSLRSSAETAAAAASVTDGEIWIDLPGKARHTPFFIPANTGGFNVSCKGLARAWTGRSPEDAVKGSGSQKEYVYVAENASVYHTSSECTHIDLSIHQIASSDVGSIRNTDGGKYHACERCAANPSAFGTLYITDHGDRYHTSIECSGLKRTVKMVEKSEAEDLRQCSRCSLRH